jgi:hypothetical protein
MTQQLGNTKPQMLPIVRFVVQISLLLSWTGAVRTLDAESTRAATSSALRFFPKLRCAWALRQSGFDLYDFANYPKFFRNDSIVELAQAGQYQGAASIEEYVKFAFEKYSPYLANTNFTPSRRNTRQTTSNKVLGYRDGLCEFRSVVKSYIVVNPVNTNALPRFNFILMVKLHLNFERRYLTKLDVYFSTDFIRIFFGLALNSPNTRRFLCDKVISGPCAGILNNSNDCEAGLQALPILSGPLNHFDGNSSGCRALHGAFAQTNPTGHCAHISFPPLADPMGRIKCQVSKQVAPSYLFTEADMEAFRAFSTEKGIDPERGHDLVEA